MVLCASREWPEFELWDPFPINKEALMFLHLHLRLMEQKPQPPPSRFSFTPPEAAEIHMLSEVPRVELDELLRGSAVRFHTPKELALEVVNRFGFNIEPSLAFPLWERYKAYCAAAEAGEVAAAADVDDGHLELEGTIYVSVAHTATEIQSIFEIDLGQIKPVPVHAYEIDPTDRWTMVSHSEIEVWPSIEFSAAAGHARTFPSRMSCVNLDSRLYFIGGVRFYKGQIVESRSVCAIKLDNISKFSPHLIEDVARMNSPKPNKYIFVAKERIFVISSAAPSMRLHRFEVYNPPTNGWTVLPEPPFTCEVNSHYVFNDNTVILGTFQDGYFSFDLEKENWNHGNLCPILSSLTPLSHPIKVGHLLLWDSEGNDVVCFGPVPDNPNSDDIAELFKESAKYSCSKQLRRDIYTFSPACKSATSLHYLGGDTFIYVIGGLSRDPFSSEEDTDDEFETSGSTGELHEACDIRLVVFKIPRGGSDFNPRVMHVVQVKCKSPNGFGGIIDCFKI